jgi:hypothetical protein
VTAGGAAVYSAIRLIAVGSWQNFEEIPASVFGSDWVTNPPWRLDSRLLCNRDKYVPNWTVLRPRIPEI